MVHYLQHTHVTAHEYPKGIKLPNFANEMGMTSWAGQYSRLLHFVVYCIKKTNGIKSGLKEEEKTHFL